MTAERSGMGLVEGGRVLLCAGNRMCRWARVNVLFNLLVVGSSILSHGVQVLGLIQARGMMPGSG